MKTQSGSDMFRFVRELIVPRPRPRSGGYGESIDAGVLGIAHSGSRVRKEIKVTMEVNESRVHGQFSLVWHEHLRATWQAQQVHVCKHRQAPPAGWVTHQTVGPAYEYRAPLVLASVVVFQSRTG